VIRSKSGRRISSVAFNDYEREVLFAPGTRFRVLARTRTSPGKCRPISASDDDTEFAEIELAEE
jgi:hypothetical protein